MCTLFRFIFIDLQNVGVISAAPCIIKNFIHLINEWNVGRIKINKYILLFQCMVVLISLLKCVGVEARRAGHPWYIHSYYGKI